MASRPSIASIAPVALAPVALAPVDELVAAFTGSRARPALALVAEYLRTPRPVTAEGVLEEPDVETLGAGLDEVVGEGGRDAVYVVAGWGAAAGFLEAGGGQLRRTEQADALSAEGADALAAASAAFSGIRALVYTEPLARWLNHGPAPVLFDAVLAVLLAAVPGGHTEPELADVAWRAFVADVALGAQARGRRKEVRADITAETGWVVELLTDLGAATREGDTVRLTPLGVWLRREQLLGEGITVPLVGELVGAPVGQVLAVTARYPPTAAAAELDGWVAAQDTGSAAVALVGHAAATDEPGERALALATLERLGDEAEPAVRTLLGVPDCRPHALAWLAARGLADDGASGVPADPGAALVEQLAVALAGRAGVGDVLAAFGDSATQAAAVEALWRVRSPHTGPVLDAVAAATPAGGVDKTVAKAARRARFKLRTAPPT